MAILGKPPKGAVKQQQQNGKKQGTKVEKQPELTRFNMKNVKYQVHLPFDVQQKILSTTENMLKEAVWGFSKKWANGKLKQIGWKSDTQVDLNQWRSKFKKCTFPSTAFATAIPSTLWHRVHEIRNCVLHQQKDIPFEVIVAMIDDALFLTTVLRDEKRSTILQNAQEKLVALYPVLEVYHKLQIEGKVESKSECLEGDVIDSVMGIFDAPTESAEPTEKKSAKEDTTDAAKVTFRDVFQETSDNLAKKYPPHPSSGTLIPIKLTPIVAPTPTTTETSTTKPQPATKSKKTPETKDSGNVSKKRPRTEEETASKVPKEKKAKTTAEEEEKEGEVASFYLDSKPSPVTVGYGRVPALLVGRPEIKLDFEDDEDEGEGGVELKPKKSPAQKVKGVAKKEVPAKKAGKAQVAVQKKVEATGSDNEVTSD